MQQSSRTVGVIGAGPAGIIASIVAAKAGWRVFLFDSNPGVGRKLLVTGGGRCNISNQKVEPRAYHTQDISFVETALEKFGREDLIAFLNDAGIPLYSTDDGWYYPLSNSARNVVDILDAVLGLYGVKKVLSARVDRIFRIKNGFRLEGGGQKKEFLVEKLIIASGGKAYPTLGSKGELFNLLKEWGHSIMPVYPALAPLEVDMSALHSLQGVRLDVTATLCRRNQALGEATGNMIFTSWGLNGPAVMDISYLVSLEGAQDLVVKINFLQNQEAVLRKIVTNHRHQNLPVKALLQSVLPEKVCVFAMKRASIDVQERMKSLSEERLEHLWSILINTPLKIKGTRDFEFAQISTGGVDVKEVDPESMHSRIVEGLYFAGEVLDVIGPCGGFNLQWAFTSGSIAGRLLSPTDRIL